MPNQLLTGGKLDSLRFAPDLMGEGPLEERLGRCVVRAGEFLRTESHRDVLRVLAEPLGLWTRELDRVTALVTAIGHVGLLAPGETDDRVLAGVAEAAGFEVTNVWPSEIFSRELCALAGREGIEARVVELRRPNDDGPAVELFLPDAEPALVRRWIADGIGTHVAFAARSPAALGEIQDLLRHAESLIPPFMPREGLRNRTRGASCVYYDVPTAAGSDMAKLRAEFYYEPEAG
jgi:hypothetical protein